jgi:hypothetical protein
VWYYFHDVKYAGKHHLFLLFVFSLPIVFLAMPYVLPFALFLVYRDSFVSMKNYISGRTIYTKCGTPIDRKEFNQWLAGLWEGDGHVFVPKTTHSTTNNHAMPSSISITVAAADLPLAELLKDIYGAHIRNKTSEGAYVVVFNSIASQQLFLSTVNGYLRTPKYHQLVHLNNWLYNKSGFVLEMLPIDTSPINSTGWLAGFIDADGSFGLSIRSGGTRPRRVTARFRLEQRMVDPKTGESYESVLLAIANYLGCKLNISTHGETQYYIIELSTQTKLPLLVEYLAIYPLLTSKANNYRDWLTGFNIILAKGHLTPEGSSTIKTLISGINSKRTVFDFSHLDCYK